MSSFDLSLVIPCYKDGEFLADSIHEIERVLKQTRYSYEIIIIDDCSPDGSAKVVEHVAHGNSHIRYLVHEKNAGRGGTVVEGMKMAQGTYVGFLDVDLEVHCRYIPSMLAALEQGYDGATAYRVYKMQLIPSMVYRAFLSIAYRKLVHALLQLPYKDTETGYKFFRREKILPVLNECECNGWFWDTEVMALSYYHGLKIQEIPCLFIRRWDKKTTVRPFHDSLDYWRELKKFKARIHKKHYL